MKKVIIIGLMLLLVGCTTNDKKIEEEKDKVIISGIYRAYGYKDTAYIEIDDNNNAVAYYPTGVVEYAGTIIISNEDKKRYELQRKDNNTNLNIEFEDDYKQFVFIGESSTVPYIKDEGDAFTEEEVKNQISNVVYMFNEVLKEEFSLEYYDTCNKAYFKSNNGNEQNIPSIIIGENDKAPDDLYFDLTEKCYYEIYNFKTMDEFNKHLSDYFTSDYIAGIQDLIDSNIIEHNGKLYLVRGGLGYGYESVNFDNVEINLYPEIGVDIEIVSMDNISRNYNAKIVKEGSKYKLDSK